MSNKDRRECNSCGATLPQDTVSYLCPDCQITPMVPKGYRAVAIRDDRGGTCAISYNCDTKTFFIVVNGTVAGPYNLRDLQQLRDNLSDVIQLRGRYHYIEDYDSAGNRKI